MERLNVKQIESEIRLEHLRGNLINILSKPFALVLLNRANGSIQHVGKHYIN